MAKSNRTFNPRSFSRNEREVTNRKLTSYLRGLASRRSTGVVTADDVHTYLTREGVLSKQVRTRLSFINSAFGSGMFEQDGMVASGRPEAKGRYITAWTLA